MNQKSKGVMFTAKSNFFPDFKKGKDAQKVKMTNLFFWFLKEEEKGDDDQVKMTHLLFCKPQVASTQATLTLGPRLH